MNKKQMKKEQEKLKRQQAEKYFDFNDKDDVMKIIKISLGVVLFIGVIFVLINIFNGTWNLFTRENAEISDQGENRVMCGTMFEQTDSEYLVLAYEFDNEDQIIYPVLQGTYQGALTIYTFDLKSGFNKTCVGEKSNITTDVTKLQLSGPTLLHIKDKKIIASKTDKESIKNYITNLK